MMVRTRNMLPLLIFCVFGVSALLYIYVSLRGFSYRTTDQTVFKAPKYYAVTEYYDQGRQQDDPSLFQYIKTLMKPPSTKPYNLKEPQRKHFTYADQSKYVGDLYGPGQRDGFFVEVGAYDGEGSSSTLYLERELGFKGLLIEPLPSNYEKLLTKGRKAYMLQAALAPTTVASHISFTGSKMQAHITSDDAKASIRVNAFPLYSILQALDVSFVDVLNLDIEGFELQVLKTIPFDKLKFGILIVEHLNIPKPKEAMIDFMKQHGYEKIHQNNYDYIFGNPEYLENLPGWKK